MDHLSQAESFLRQRQLGCAAHHFQHATYECLPTDRIDSGLWQLCMLSGDFEEAWKASDRIRARNGHDPHRFWKGESIMGRDIVIRCLHGLGDSVQMFRYASQLSCLAKSVTWQVSPHLVELAGYFRGVDQVITWEQPCRWELEIEVTELPRYFRTVLLDLPIEIGYLELSAPTEVKTKPRVGVVWKAGEWNQSRSIPLSAFDAILSTPNCDFISLQGGINPEVDPRLETIAPGLMTLATTIASLDLIITVDTLAAHLAGALRIPAFVLLEHAADWRWMLDRDDSPWYPSLRLFRQTRPGDWHAPLYAISKFIGTLRA